MTLTLNLAPDVEAALGAAARQSGRTREEMAAEAVQQVYAPVSGDTEARATIKALREGIVDGEAGREQPFEEFVAEARAVRATCRAADARPSAA